MSTIMRRLVLGTVVLLTIAACSGGATGGTSTTAAPTTAAPTTTAATGAVSDLASVRSAVVLIEAEGTFVDPEVGERTNVPGRGSGFFVDPSGIVVTNNHVVTGAAILRVWVDGEDAPRNARILGVSECSDLAVLQVDGDGFSYLDWYEGPIDVGTKVYAAGFPLGDPEFTLTEGIVAKERASGESDWSSVDSVIEHTARLLPGNSGGPLVADDARVVGVDYASAQAVDAFYAITRDEVLRVYDDLVAGRDVTSLGINGTAVSGTDPSGASVTGIWVWGVASGSPADRVGIEPGDVVTRLEGLVLADDGTMEDYCDVLRSRGPDDALAVEVLRFGTGELLRGTINGDEPLAVAFSFSDALGDEVAASSGSYEYEIVSDDTDTIAVELPTAWSDRSGVGWVWAGEEVGVSVAAAPSLQGFYDTWTTPGMFFGASDVLAGRTSYVGEILDALSFSDCTYEGRESYEDAYYTGVYDLYSGCGGTDTAFIAVEAYTTDMGTVLLVQVQVVSEADLDALDRILASFVVTG